ncbi:acyl-CoA N-acyltransferase [Violaceomyces palustris]|uniref:Acyl-CoA N-acyltransferase n=1 Tax=Violaceomyces palustris TaxID=1673888 RepID=A0ACD0NNL2_9BASI|nr:acyl-CoA N-acyltransferase [Violaceomyces palustris]
MAYGHVPRPQGSRPGALVPRIYPLKGGVKSLVMIPFTSEGVEQEEYERLKGGGAECKGLLAPNGLVEYMREVFNEELERGVTYPQRGPMDDAEFRAYFLGYDLLAAFFVDDSGEEIPTEGKEVSLSILGCKVSELDPKSRLAGFYYIKPNYPHRSSHICNGGFVVPPNARGQGLGSVLGRTFLHYAPRAGYRASVFNLVYANNLASIRIWERLGFTKVGLLPQAGLLRKEDGSGEEEYVDAWIIHKNLLD